MNDSERIELLHRLAELSLGQIDSLAEEAKQLAQSPMMSIPLATLKFLADELTRLQDATCIKMPCKVEGDLYINAMFYPSEKQFLHCTSPDLVISKIQFEPSIRISSKDRPAEAGDLELDHIYLRDDLQPSLTQFPELKRFEQVIVKVAEQYGVPVPELARKLQEIKLAKDRGSRDVENKLN